MKDITKFQGILLALFLIAAVGSVLSFAVFGNRGRNDVAVEPIVVWGTLDEQAVNNFLRTLRSNGVDLNMTYYGVSEAGFDQALIEALAGNRGPDAIFLPENMIVRYRDKIVPTSYETLSVRSFKDTYLEGTELFLRFNGVFGNPVLIDPLVMYWNRDLFSTHGVVSPPDTWNDLLTIVPVLRVKDAQGAIVKAGASLGTYDNIVHAKDIIATLLLQTENPLVAGDVNGSLQSVFNDKTSIAQAPAVSALIFYTGFSDPLKAYYTWNSGLSNSRDMFTAGDSALYFGFASEVQAIRARNPNLNFDVAMLPQTLGSNNVRVFGHMYSFVPLATVHYDRTVALMNMISSRDIARSLSEWLSMAPARKDLISESQSDPYKAVMYRSALSARSWLDPNRGETEKVFKRLIDTITSGKLRLEEAVNRADTEIDGLIR